MVNSIEYRRCFQLFAQRDYGRCARESMPLIDQAHTHELLQVFLISLFRSGQHRVAEDLAAAINEAVEHDPWASALLRLTLGQTGPDAVLALIRDAKQRCQGFYYIGANQLTHAYEGEAHHSFDASIETGIRCTEGDLARLERAAPVISPVAMRAGLTVEQWDWFDQRARAAGAVLKEGHRGEALDIAEHMFQRACDSLNEDGVGMGAAMQQIGMVYFVAGEHRMARNMFQEAKDLFLENFGARHRAHVDCMQQLAAIEGASGSASKANELLKEKERLITLTIGAGAANAQ